MKELKIDFDSYVKELETHFLDGHRKGIDHVLSSVILAIRQSNPNLLYKELKDADPEKVSVLVNGLLGNYLHKTEPKKETPVKDVNKKSSSKKEA